MTRQSYPGLVQGNTIILLEKDVSLPDGTLVSVTPVTPGPGNGAAIVAAVRSGPPVTREDVEELERAIAAGERPPSGVDPFPEE